MCLNCERVKDTLSICGEPTHENQPAITPHHSATISNILTLGCIFLSDFILQISKSNIKVKHDALHEEYSLLNIARISFYHAVS